MTNGLLLWADDEMELLRAHLLFLEKKGYVLTGERKEACDINMDNQVTITDLTQLMFIFEDID